VVRSSDVIADRYRLVEVVGSGDWLADDLREHRQVVLKRPVPADLAGQVTHPNVVKVFGVVGDGADSWLATEHFPATSLAAKGILPPRQVAAIGTQVARALTAAHEVDVVHGNVTPGNVLVADNGTVKITGFGGAGSDAYVSPEIADGGPATAASDVFSLGATLFAAVEGEPPFGTGDRESCLRRIRSSRGEIPVRAGALKPVLEALLQRDQNIRPTAAEAGEMLDRVASGLTVPAWPGVKRRPRALLVAVAIAVVGVLLLAIIRPWEGEAGGPMRTVLGDPRTADPCAVADASVLDRFGEATLNANYGGFNRCDVLIAVAGDDEIDVMFEFDANPAAVTSGPSRVVRQAPQRDSAACGIVLTLADQAELEVTAKSDDDVDTDFCQVAAVAADHAESVLGRYQEIPRRAAFDPRSLANLDACGFLAPELAPAGTSLEPGFANWTCRWPSADGSLRVIFEHADLNSAREGDRLTLSGREVYVAPKGYGDFTCAAKVFHLRYLDSRDEPYVELVLVVAEGGVAMADLCSVVTTMAGPVAARLPEL
jgi:hypothetical protein